MIESYYVGVYWGRRKEDSQECARRASLLLNCLSGCDPLLAEWFEKGQTREESLRHPISSAQNSLEKAFAGGANRGEFTGKPLGDLGLRLSLWTGGRDEEAATLTVKCGCYTSSPLLNSCVLGLPFSGAASQRLLRTSRLTAILQCMVNSWDPDWGVAMSRAFQARVAAALSTGPRVGWILYLSNRRGSIPDISPRFKRMGISGLGTLIFTTEEQFTVTNPSHIDLADQLAKALMQKGLLDGICQ